MAVYPDDEDESAKNSCADNYTHMGKMAAMGDYGFTLHYPGNSGIIRRTGALGYAAAVVIAGIGVISDTHLCAGKSPDLGGF